MASNTPRLGLTMVDGSDLVSYETLNRNFMLVESGVASRDRVANKLDNSYFVDPANQRGQASYTGTYGIDRWRVWDTGTMKLENGGLTVQNESMYQYFELGRLANKNHTLAAMTTNGELLLYTRNPHDAYGWGDNGLGLGVDMGVHVIGLPPGRTYAWAALYEGEYTAETLPAYVYKGYAAELAECQRYYLHVGADSNAWIVGKYIIGWGLIVEFPVQMRTNGSVIKGDSGKIQAFSASGWEDVSVSYVNVRGGATHVCLSSPVNVSAGDSCLVAGIAGISADL